MTTIATIIRQIAASLPQTILRADWQDPQLVIQTSDWSLAIMTPWRVLDRGTFLFGSDDIQPDEVAKILDGNVIIDCKQQSSVASVDPLLVFESGHILEVFSVGPLDPWIFSPRGGERFMASPSE